MAYSNSAPLYDLFVSENDISYYRELGLQYGSALEIGVGTARVALELARVGVEVWGIDSSFHMLEEAREKLAKEPSKVQKKVRLLEANMMDFDLNRIFPLVYIPSSTIQYCASKEEQIRCLRAVNRHLSKNGLLAFNLILPAATYSSNPKFIGKATRGDITIMRFIFYQLNRKEQTLEVTLLFEIYKKGIMEKRFYDSSTVAVINKPDIVSLLEKTEFKVEKIYGSYEKSKKIVSQVVIEARKI